MTGEPRCRIDVAEATALVQAGMPAWPAEPVPLDQAAGEVLREIVVAEREQPPFDRVTMDGIAFRHAGFARGLRTFTVTGCQGAGAAAITLGGDDTCVEIMTGAALPAGADTVVPVERIRREGDQAVLEPGYEPSPGQFIHRRGSDHAGGTTLLSPGTVLGPPEMAVLTIGGRPLVQVTRRPAIAIISTGDELVEVGEPISPFQIRSSNERALAAALARRGFVRCTRARLPDDPVVLEREIGALYASHDVLIVSGGVSMGRFDYVPKILQDLGMGLVFHRILQRPGLPMWFGLSTEGKPVFALPGNPVSSLMCLVRYVVPGLVHGLGAPPAVLPRVRLADEVRFEADLTYFLPVVLEWMPDGTCLAHPRPTNTSGDFVALAGTGGFVELPRGGRVFAAGHAADFHAW